MASTYKKVPLYKVVKTWEDNNPNPSEVYKLQSNNTCNKSRVEIHKDNGKYGIEFTIDKNATLIIGPTSSQSLTIDCQVESKE
jgi:hypothetical protein